MRPRNNKCRRDLPDARRIFDCSLLSANIMPFGRNVDESDQTGTAHMFREIFPLSLFYAPEGGFLESIECHVTFVFARIKLKSLAEQSKGSLYRC